MPPFGGWGRAYLPSLSGVTIIGDKTAGLQKGNVETSNGIFHGDKSWRGCGLLFRISRVSTDELFLNCFPRNKLEQRYTLFSTEREP